MEAKQFSLSRARLNPRCIAGFQFRNHSYIWRTHPMVNDLRNACRNLFALLLIVGAAPASADSFGPITFNFTNLVTGDQVLNPAIRTFSVPKFDASLGSLQRIYLSFNFFGTVTGSATGVSQSSNATIDHWVFFDFDDTPDSVYIAEPTLHVAQAIPSGAANATILFGPEFRSSIFPISVASGDPL